MPRFPEVRNPSTGSSSLFALFGYPGRLIGPNCAGNSSRGGQCRALISKPFVPWFRWHRFWNRSDSSPTNVPVINSVAHAPCMVQARRKAVPSRQIQGEMHITASSAAPRATNSTYGQRCRKPTCTPQPSTYVRNCILMSPGFVNGSRPQSGCPMASRTDGKSNREEESVLSTPRPSLSSPTDSAEEPERAPMTETKKGTSLIFVRRETKKGTSLIFVRLLLVNRRPGKYKNQ